MPGLFGGNRNTRELTATSYTVERGGGGSRLVPTLLAVCCVVLAAYAAYQVLREQFAPASRVSQLEAENRQLRRQLVDETAGLLLGGLRGVADAVTVGSPGGNLAGNRTHRAQRRLGDLVEELAYAARQLGSQVV